MNVADLIEVLRAMPAHAEVVCDVNPVSWTDCVRETVAGVELGNDHGTVAILHLE